MAVYFNGGRIHEEQAQRPRTFAMLAEHFFATFPQLEGVSFSHAWGGVIDTCTRFAVVQLTRSSLARADRNEGRLVARSRV